MSHLNRAKVIEDDEYYTFYDDIRTHLDRYKHLFRDKVVYCNCDRPDKTEQGCKILRFFTS